MLKRSPHPILIPFPVHPGMSFWKFHPPFWAGTSKSPFTTMLLADPTLMRETLSIVNPLPSETPAPSNCRLFRPTEAVTLTLKLKILLSTGTIEAIMTSFQRTLA